MKIDLSIIIPCYNCAETLEEAVRSCYTQGLEEACKTFEIVMVDDGSTDHTRLIMERLVHENATRKSGGLRIFFHNKNMGGGATRNTAIAHAHADIIFCLDSDDMLAPNTLSKMLLFMEKKLQEGKACDGVGIHHSKKFRGRNTNDVDCIHTFGYVDEHIPLESLLQKNDLFCPLYSTFMHTKKAFSIAGGYHTDHGFDTQSFAWRFLVNNLSAYTCPDTTYLHRMNFHTSYYNREYQSGRVNYNWLQIFMEFFYIFDAPTQQCILEFDINSEKNLFNEIKDRKAVFSLEHNNYIKQGTRQYARNEIGALPTAIVSKYNIYWLANEYAKEAQYNNALKYFIAAFKKGLSNPVRFNKIMFDVVNNTMKKMTPKEIVTVIVRPDDFIKRGASAPITTRITRKLISIIKRHPQLRHSFIWIYSLQQRMRNLYTEKEEKRLYYAQIEQIKKTKRIIVDLSFGGLGDCLVWSPFPRLLKEVYGIDFYVSRRSLDMIRQKDTFKLCFKMNPYFKGTLEDGPIFRSKVFETEKSLYTLLTDREGKTIIENLEKQFKVIGRGKPELYYTPSLLDEYAHTVIVDNNYISGKIFKWAYKENIFEIEATRHKGTKDHVEYVDIRKQDLFGYIDLIYSCKYFVCTFSGGASIAACFDKPFTVIWPLNGKNGSNYQFRYKKSAGHYL